MEIWVFRHLCGYVCINLLCGSRAKNNIAPAIQHTILLYTYETELNAFVCLYILNFAVFVVRCGAKKCALLNVIVVVHILIICSRCNCVCSALAPKSSSLPNLSSKQNCELRFNTPKKEDYYVHRNTTHSHIHCICTVNWLMVKPKRSKRMYAHKQTNIVDPV